MDDKSSDADARPQVEGQEQAPTFVQRVKRLIFGRPRDLSDSQLVHHISVVAFLAWIGLGADGLSSSAYGPEEAFRTLGRETYLAVPLALLMMTTVFVISYAYSRIIEEFPHGGGGYIVSTAILGPRAGIVSGAALMVDYVLTITISIAAAGDALFSMLPSAWHEFKLPTEVVLVAGLTVINIRGLKESIVMMMPVFLLFLATHVVLIAGGILGHGAELPTLARDLHGDFRAGLSTLGVGGMLLLFMHAYSLGGGTYTGIEAVSNGLSIMREPRVKTAKRTMLYMAISLALTAGGLILCYLLSNVQFEPGMTMNAVLSGQVADNLSLGPVFVVLTLVSEGALLVVAAQTGFVAGPRVLANMAIDSWAPRRFASLSERLTTRNGIVLMGGAALAALLYTRGDVRHIVVMYSINVFLTFSLTELSMCSFWIGGRKKRTDWKRKISIHTIGLVMCSTILAVTVYEKFREGGWITLTVTGMVLLVCFFVRHHYDQVAQKLKRLDRDLVRESPAPRGAIPALDPAAPTAAVLVSNYDGLGIHSVMNIPRIFPGTFKNFVFVSVGVVDSADFRGAFAVDAVRQRREAAGAKYVALANSLGVPATFRYAIGTDVVDEAVKLCQSVAVEFSRVTFFAGKIVFERERWLEPLLHNQTAFAIQRRLHWAGNAMVILPVRVR
ncbi:MAG: APC family permease [Phycisphaerales bacterium]|nr:APC family permease [Phycisphaerales bacterium]